MEIKLRKAQYEELEVLHEMLLIKTIEPFLEMMQ